MATDPSFVEYVEARWPTLYRLAALLVGEERADEVAQEALVRAYLTWPRRVEDDPPEEKVKGVLARLALAEQVVPREATGVRSRFEALPPRQRVVVVLRWFDYLPDADVARALGFRRDDVAAEAAQALAALGAPEAEVAAILAGAADDVVVPLAPGDALLARCHAARRRRAGRSLRLAGLAAVGLVLVLALGDVVQSDHHARAPASVDFPRNLAALSHRDSPRTPYAELSTLHLAGTTVQLEANPTAIATAGQWTYVSYSNGSIVRVDREGRSEPVATSAAGPPVTDPLGRYVAWVEARPGLPLVVVEPTGRGARSGRREHSFPASGEPVTLVGVTPSGDVLGSLAAEGVTWVWPASADSRADDPFHEVDGLGIGAVYQVTAKELVVQYPPDRFAVGRLEHDAFVAEEDLVATIADFSDPRGRRVVYADGAGEVHVGRRRRAFGRDQSHDLRLQLPRLRGGTSGIAWEDDRHVLLEVADDSMPLGALVRCDVDTGGCEIAVAFGDAPHRLAR